MAKKITVTQKRWLVSTHILCNVVWLGTTLCFLVLSLAAVTTQDIKALHTIYVMVDVLDKTLIWTSSIGTMVTGILLSILTHWGLTRFYWIIVKEVLTLLSFGLGIFGLHGWLNATLSMTTGQDMWVVHTSAYTLNQYLQFGGVGFQLLALTGIVIISVFKPWGQRGQPKKSVRSELARAKSAHKTRLK